LMIMIMIVRKCQSHVLAPIPIASKVYWQAILQVNLTSQASVHSKSISVISVERVFHRKKFCSLVLVDS
jgi:hypothetical protein